MAYDPDPRYAVMGEAPIRGYPALAAEISVRGVGVLAVDGPASLPWEAVSAGLSSAMADAGIDHRWEGVWERYVAWGAFESLTESPGLRDDPDFARLPTCSLADLLPEGSRRRPTSTGETLVVVHGPGAALVEHDALWMLEHARDQATAMVRSGRGQNLGQALGSAGTWRRMAFVDWPLMERHWGAVAPAAQRYVDVTDPEDPTSVSMTALRSGVDALVRQPFRTRPTYQPGVWGGQWLKRLLDEDGVSNLAWSYELIAPESDVTLGPAAPVRVGLPLLVRLAGRDLLGAGVLERFGPSFPIRMDYLDTMEGEPLSAHCHPTEEYADRVFGLEYSQHESYYVMESGPGTQIYLGLRDDVDPARFRQAVEAASERQQPLELDEFAATHEARRHQLYLIPAGTLHASGRDNVVLEISSTPYLYSLRFYDWLRRDLDGRPRPVHPEHAFANLDLAQRGAALGALVPTPARVRGSDGSVEVELGRLDALDLLIRRLEFDEAIEDDTSGVFHVLNLVHGDEVTVETAEGVRHGLSYAETVLVPAAVGPYRVVGERGGSFRVVKALIGPGR